MDYYSRIADGYDELHGSEQIAKLELISEGVKGKGLVLDVGSGTGISRSFFKNVVQLDPSLALLQKSSGMRVCGVAEFLPFKDHVFDVVISVTSLHHVGIDKAVSEVARVSKPNASFAFSIFKRSSNFDKIVSSLKSRFELNEKDSEKDLILFKHVE
ncbi:MAG: class I SAM-dependent methyltransferase [archaeon]